MNTIKTAVILAGGRGTRLSEQTHKIPKPLVELHKKPIILHIMEKLAKDVLYFRWLQNRRNL